MDAASINVGGDHTSKSGNCFCANSRPMASISWGVMSSFVERDLELRPACLAEEFLGHLYLDEGGLLFASDRGKGRHQRTS